MRATAVGHGRKYLGLVVAAVARASPMRRGSSVFNGARLGRGNAVGRLIASGDRVGPPHSRRAIVKTRLVRLAGKGIGRARAHLRYIQRDGISRSGEPGRLYSATEDEADGKTFLGRCEPDRHQFRFIVSAEDGAEYEDLKPLIRQVMAKMEADLGTRLDWVAADHLDTAHPHTHIMLRGKDELGADLVIARDYIRAGLRERVAEQVSLDLGPRTDLEIKRKLRLEVGAERLTSLDRRLLRDMDYDRAVAVGGGNMFDHSLRAGRLKTLADMGLAAPLGDGRWRLAENVEATLREMGERGDIIRTMQRALRAQGVERGGADHMVHKGGLPDGRPLVGRLIGRGLSDELRDRHYILVDATDGRVHYVDAGSGDALEPLAEGAILRVEARKIAVGEADLVVARIAAQEDGRYSEALHYRHDPGATPDYVQAHVRRLEAIRKAVGGPERTHDGRWSISGDHLRRAAAFEAARVNHRPLRIEILSSMRLEALVEASGATWLDRELVAGRPELLRESGFGAEARTAKVARQGWLVGQGLAEEGEAGIRYRKDLLAVLRQRELLELDPRLEREFALPSRTAEKGDRVTGMLHRRLDLASGRFGLIEGVGELVLVPWKPGLERHLGRELSGKVGPSGFSWSLGRGRSGPQLG